LKGRCYPKAPQRKVTKLIYEESCDVARVLVQAQQYATSGKRSRCLRSPLKPPHGHVGFDYVANVVPMTNFSSLQSPKTSKSLQNGHHIKVQSEKSCKSGSQPSFKTNQGHKIFELFNIIGRQRDQSI